MACYEFQGITPVVDPASYVHPLASIIGDVIIGPGCFIGPGASLRGDFGRIIMQADANVQDNATIHVSSLRDTVLSRGATIAHGAVVHGCTIGENCLIGINAVVLDAAELGPECMVAAQAMVSHGFKAPARSLLMGTPAQIVRELAADQIVWRNDGQGEYQQLTREALASLKETAPLAEVEPDRPRITLEARPVSFSDKAES